MFIWLKNKIYILFRTNFWRENYTAHCLTPSPQSYEYVQRPILAPIIFFINNRNKSVKTCSWQNARFTSYLDFKSILCTSISWVIVNQDHDFVCTSCCHEFALFDPSYRHFKFWLNNNYQLKIVEEFLVIRK